MHSIVVNPTGMLDKSFFFGAYTDRKGFYFVSETSLTSQSIIEETRCLTRLHLSSIFGAPVRPRTR